MRVTLSESYRMRKRKGGMAVVSLLIHTVILVGVLAGTGHSKAVPSAEEVVDTVIYTQPEPIPARPVTAEPGGGESAPAPRGPRLPA